MKNQRQSAALIVCNRRVRTIDQASVHISIGKISMQHDVNGQAVQVDSRQYSWDALIRLVSAELNQAGQLYRQYIYLADMPIAVIDTPQGKTLSNQELTAHVSLGLDLQIIVKSAWNSLTSNSSNSDKAETTSWLHTNHLGAPEAATNSEGQLIWQASYAPFGGLIKTSLNTPKTTQASGKAFKLNLRFPGQYEDAETGLYYNKQRYYDPARGEYLSPDPLGTPDGPNGYAYVRYNPLRYVDPEGLILFAFDGTGNTESSRTNVFWMREAYQDNDGTLDANNKPLALSNRPFYIDGPGTGQFLDGAHADIGGGYAGSGGDEGDLSDVALNWMFEQAKTATGGKMKALEPDQLKVTNPILHDESRVAPWNIPGLGGLSSDRTMTYLDGSSTKMREAQTEGMTYTQSQQGQAADSKDPKYINYDKFFAGNKAGKVNMTNYKQWLQG